MAYGMGEGVVIQLSAGGIKHADGCEQEQGAKQIQPQVFEGSIHLRWPPANHHQTQCTNQDNFKPHIQIKQVCGGKSTGTAGQRAV